MQRFPFSRTAAMSRKHENLLRSIFQDPVSGNIQWREVESLLHHLGATTEPLAKARLRVRLNGVEGTLHRPHHGDALGRQDILHIREYLAHARATPSQYEAIRKGSDGSSERERASERGPRERS
jgi:hypothetical protein